MSYRRKKPTPGGQVWGNSRQLTLSGMNADTQSEEKLISTADLYSGQPYQRPVKNRVVDRLVREWDPITLLMGSIGCALCERKTAARM